MKFALGEAFVECIQVENGSNPIALCLAFEKQLFGSYPKFVVKHYLYIFKYFANNFAIRRSRITFFRR
jgi:hypothetical protein